ncbi:MAG: Eco57I restriction-modification methylase domain-containing protein [Candidatus Krumholzibacteriia bacterium]
MPDAGPFLDGISLRTVSLAASSPLRPHGLALGQGTSALEVLITSSAALPAAVALRSAWKARNAGRAAPLLLVVLHGEDRASLCGPAGDDPPAYLDLDRGQVERLCREALEQPDRHAALRALRDVLLSLGSDLCGLRNEGFLATHELRTGVRERADWSDCGRKARGILPQRGPDLLVSLGFQIERHDNVTSVLRAGDRKIAVAVLLQRDESPELQGERFGALSPITHALAVADRENLPWVIIQHGAKIRIYPSKLGLGVGRRGRTETYIECHAGLLPDTDAAYLWLLCSADALVPGGTLEQLLDESGRFAGELARSLRERIYESVVPKLAAGIVVARDLRRPTPQDLTETYEMALVVLFRLLFIAYAEDKDLLPFRWNGLYQRRSLKTKAQEMADLARAGAEFDPGDSLWDEVTRLFRAVDKGNREWGVPAYDGGLFADEPEVSPAGARLATLTLPNTILGPALRDLLLIEGPEGLGPVDFRSLGVREFGTIYEGLLESELSLAQTDLVVDKSGNYRPVKTRETPAVRKGEVYLHNASGARKSTGSYFTKQFAVEHLLERALDPALDEHLARLDALDDDQAGERFFDFRVADIAMGSGHFLVAAIDHVERKLTGYLARRRLPAVGAELATLRQAALTALGSLADQVEIEDSQLLRRLIARRCIYGVDINATAVQLARLSIWIHTFVPGLPLSLLDHGLVHGNSLVGIGRLEELKDIVHSFFELDAAVLLGDARAPLERLARIADATPADLTRARRALSDAAEAIKATSALCDIATAARLDGQKLDVDLTRWSTVKGTLPDSRTHKAALKRLRGLCATHLPLTFPEVFLRDRPGFDVILGNPPWEKAQVEEHEFWCRHSPGLRGLPQREQEIARAMLVAERPDLGRILEQEIAQQEVMRAALMAGPFPGMGSGHPDLYKAFCWRFWTLACPDGGRIGVVLPRSALAAKGSTEFRQEVFANAENVDVTMLLNNKQWFFEDVHPQYTIGLVELTRRKTVRTTVAMRGPYPSRDRYQGGISREPAVFYGDEIQGWNDTASLPLLPTDESVEVFTQLRISPRLDFDDKRSWRARPIQGDLNSTTGKPWIDLKSLECPEGFWPVYKGESFDLWTPDTGTYYAWADPQRVLPHLQEKRLRGGRGSNSPFFEFGAALLKDPKTLPCLQPRIAFRDVSRATDSRTLRAALLPPEVFVVHLAPYLLLPRGSAGDLAFLLGVLSSLPLDWFARRFVETHLTFFVFNPLPIPRPPADHPLRLRAIELAGRLACPDDRFAKWAEAVGVSCGPLASDEKGTMIHELDAVVALLYGLNEKQLAHVFETFHEGWDCAEQLRETRQHFRALKRRMV